MLTYIIRRLLYSTVVLVLASFLVFTFVTVSGDPLAGLRIAPNVSELTVQNVIDRKHLDDPVPKRYLYWVQDHWADERISGDELLAEIEAEEATGP